MSKINFSGICNDIEVSMKKHSPEITLGLGIAGMLTALVVTSRATIKAHEIVGNKRVILKRSSNLRDADKSIPAMDALKLTWKCYIPSVALCTISIACLIESNSIHTKRYATLAAAYNLSSSALSEYKSKVIERIGEKKARDIHDDIMKDKVSSMPVDCGIEDTGKGQTMFYEPQSGRLFKSNIDDVRAAENIMNNKLLNEGYISLNDFYSELGLRSTDLGEVVGWKDSDGLVFDLSFSSCLSEDDIPCTVIYYALEPRIDFETFN